MSTPRILPALLALAAFGVALPATAQVVPGYLGVGYAQHTNKQWNGSVIDDGSFSSIDVDDTDTGVRVMGGFGLSTHFSLELGYTNLGEVTASGTSDGSGLWSPGPVSARLSGTAFDIAAVGKWRGSARVSVLARLGLLFWESDAFLGETNFEIRGDNDGDDVFFGFGVEVDVTRSLAVRGDIVRYNLDDFDVDSVGLTLIWRHGD